MTKKSPRRKKQVEPPEKVAFGPDPVKPENVRDKLIARCEESLVAMEVWRSRNSSSAMRNVGALWALLKAGCPFKLINPRGYHGEEPGQVFFIRVYFRGNDLYETRGRVVDSELYYLPSKEKIQHMPENDWVTKSGRLALPVFKMDHELELEQEKNEKNCEIE